MNKPDEKRRYKRVGADGKIKIDRLGVVQGLEEFQMGNISNISAGGVLLEYKWPFDTGEYLSVHFLAPNSVEFFKITAKVLRCRKKSVFDYDICVMFTNLDKTDEKRLNYYLTYK